MNRIGGALAGALVLAGGCGGGPQIAAAPEAWFASPPDTILTHYVNVPAAAWLGGTRWAVAASEFNEAVVIDFADRTIRTLGSPRHRVENPVGVFSVADTVHVADWVRRDVTIWEGTRLTFLGSIPAPAALRGVLPRSRDMEGRLYFEVLPPPAPDRSAFRDSAAVVRSDAGLTRFDTVARLSPLDVAEVEDRGGRRLQRRVFSGADEWGVVPDGSVWVARVYLNRVDWMSPDGRVTRGEALPDRIFEVTSTDLEHWLLQFPDELRPAAEQLPWSPIKPPFTKGLTAGDGRVWLEKSRAVADSLRTYHVVDPDGRLVLIAVLPIRQGHVIAVGDTRALVAEQYADGVRLMQAPLPAAPPAEGTERQEN